MAKGTDQADRRRGPHRWTSEEASQAGHLGGLAKARNDQAKREQEARLEALTTDDAGEDSLDPEEDEDLHG